MRRIALPLALAASILAPAASAAQTPDLVARAIRANAGRAELDSILRATRQAAEAARGRTRDALTADAADLQARLSNGDFRVGDLIVVEQRGEVARTDTAIVGADLAVRLPGVPPISVRGVLLGELPGHMAREVARYVRNAQTTATPLRRIGVFGAVTNPGYYFVGARAPLSDILSIAGATGDADPKRMSVQRAGRTIVDRASLTVALQGSLSFAALGVESGDIVQIGRTPAPIDRSFWFQVIGLGIGILTTIAFLGA